MNLRRKLTGLKHDTEVTDSSASGGRLVGERCHLLRRSTERRTGALASEDVGISSDKSGENPDRRKPKVSLSNVRQLRVSRS